MTQILDYDAYLQSLLSAPRPGIDKVLAFYDSRTDAICRDARLMFVPMDDHMVHRGDAVFESLNFMEGRLYQLEPHLRRMARSAESIFMKPPMPWEKVGEIVQDLARATGSPDGSIRILLGRGPGGFGISPDECPQTALYMVAYEIRHMDESDFEKGVTACRSSIPAKQSYMATIKSNNYLPNMLMKREAQERGCDFALCFTEEGLLAEGAIENVCMVDKDGTIVVPEFTNALQGTTLLRGLELIRNERDVFFRAVREEELYEAREIIMMGTTVGAIGVVRFNDKPIHDVKPGPVAKRLRELLHNDLLENGIPL